MESAVPRYYSPAFHHQRDLETDSCHSVTTECSESGKTCICHADGQGLEHESNERNLGTKDCAWHLLQSSTRADDEVALLNAPPNNGQEQTPRTSPGIRAPSALSEHRTGVIISTLEGIWRMARTSPRGDRLHWSALSYFTGSLVFICNSLLAWVAHAYPSTELPGQIEYGVGLTTLPGTILFWIGAFLEFAETVNRVSSDGSARKKDVEHGQSFSAAEVPQGKQVPEEVAESEDRPCVQPDRYHAKDEIDRRPSWIPTFHDLTNHHIKDTNFRASSIQLAGATVFLMIGFVDLPGIFPEITPLQKIALYWVPDIIASCCFLGASIFFIVAAKEKRFTAIWWTTIWSFIGSIGFLLNGVLGPVSFTDWIAECHCLLAGFWGSVAFLFSSACQIYDCANKRCAEPLSQSHDRIDVWTQCPSQERLAYPAKTFQRAASV